jgi:hypothetical protein
MRVPAAQNLNSGATQRLAGEMYFIVWFCCAAKPAMAWRTVKTFVVQSIATTQGASVTESLFFRFPRDPKRFVYYDVCMRRLEYGGLRTFAHVPACQPIDRSEPFAHCDR